jgi:hypothetical protein
MVEEALIEGEGVMEGGGSMRDGGMEGWRATHMH